MKKTIFLGLCLSAIALWSCNNSDSTTGADSTAGNSDTANQSAGTTVNIMPLTKADSTFVMEAAINGLMEVQGGQLAQQNAESQRVKDLANMLVTDHTKANDELKGLASGHGMTLPDTLPSDKKAHLQSMQGMKGKNFDRHYIGMMNSDHKKTIDLFQKQANAGTDGQIKTWAQNTIPTLQKHADSVAAIRKGM